MQAAEACCREGINGTDCTWQKLYLRLSSNCGLLKIVGEAILAKCSD
jgi:hypothetical protein